MYKLTHSDMATDNIILRGAISKFVPYIVSLMRDSQFN